MNLPRAEKGDVVLWYPGAERSQEPLPAVVTAVAASTVCLHVMSRELKNFLIKDGVRHVDDDVARKPELQEMGAWDLTPAGKRLACLHAEAAARAALAKSK